jgi:Ca2+:H+ antiporter
VVRRILAVLLLLGPITIAAEYAGAGKLTLFVLAAASLIPLAWLIGEATEHAAHHTGPGVGGFLNATFGNAPELIIALLAVHDGLTDVVRGSLVGSVVGNLLLVLGLSLVVGGKGTLDRRSSLTSLGLCGVAVALFMIPAIAGFDGDPDRRSLAFIALPEEVILLVIYVAVTVIALRRHLSLHTSDDPGELNGWSLRASLAALTGATIITALVAEVLVGSLEEFASKANLSDFFVAAVIVAIVGNAAEHGGALVVAAKGNITLAAEIALSSSAQVAVFLIPAVGVLSFLFSPLTLSFRVVELAALGGAVAGTALILWGGQSSRLRGALLLAGYIAAAVVFFLVGDRPV